MVMGEPCEGDSWLCFKSRSMKVPLSQACLGPVSVLVLGTNQLSVEGAKALPFQLG